MKSVSILMLLASLIGLAQLGCSSAEVKDRPATEPVNAPPTPDVPLRSVLIRSDYQVGEVARLCAESISNLDVNLKGVKTAFDLDRVLTDFNDLAQPLIFMGYVSLNEAIRKEGSECEEKYNKALVDVFTRRNLYLAVKSTTVQNADDERLVIELRHKFEKYGMSLKDKDLKTFKKMRTELAELEAKFMKNYNEDASTVTFSGPELEGVSDSFLSRLKKNPAGLYIVTTKTTDVFEVMMNAKSSETRKKVMFAFENRAAAVNSAIMNQAILLREQIAKLAGYKNWAEYRIKGNMAKNPAMVMALLNELKEKLAPRYEKEMAQLLEAKRQMVDPNATQVDAWDVRYLTYQIQKRDFDLDDDVVREYFPKDKVVAGLFEVYSTLLGVRFQEVKGAAAWAPEVKLYGIIEKRNNTVIGYFYTDFVPRAGKYGHAAAFQLIDGRREGRGYSQPVSAIVANMSPPTPDRPSLMTHTEVRTLFHEFGHIMHQTLTKAPYGCLSGSQVARDFVEAPSQMLENWVFEPVILRKISGYYKDPAKPIPDDLIAKILAAQKYEHNNFPTAFHYMRQLTFALTDMSLHTSTGPVDVDEVYRRIHKEVMGFDPVEGSHFMASFGHLMNDYDAGYYGYLWSEVYAQDLFSAFQKEGVLSPTVGARYRAIILEQGDMVEALDLISDFLGRQPTNDAFYSKLGL